jgi:hypothetical protein
MRAKERNSPRPGHGEVGGIDDAFCHLLHIGSDVVSGGELLGPGPARGQGGSFVSWANPAAMSESSSRCERARDSLRFCWRAFASGILKPTPRRVPG